jgi:hypothetical protein
MVHWHHLSTLLIANLSAWEVSCKLQAATPHSKTLCCLTSWLLRAGLQVGKPIGTRVCDAVHGELFSRKRLTVLSCQCLHADS